ARAHALALAQNIAAKSPLAMTGTKRALNHARDHGTAASLQHMAVLQSAIFDGTEMAEAIEAWKDKRPGRFDPLEGVAPL
ncbi:MAG TPA: enoyl-CoA hydratase, partial [Burkholderiaceae bacterium]|nr:enoyl-CoA hydratase [Burkholderiaceae bacterium]